jgi:hypothetical protein
VFSHGSLSIEALVRALVAGDLSVSELMADTLALIEELMAGSARWRGVSFKEGAVERLLAYARAVAHFPTAVKEFEWRNGYFHAISVEAKAAGEADPFPKHTALLEQVGAV